MIGPETIVRYIQYPVILCFSTPKNLKKRKNNLTKADSGTILYKRQGPVAQWIEQLPSKQWVVGSIPPRTTNTNNLKTSELRL